MGGRKEIWFVQQKRFFLPQSYPVHWKGIALWVVLYAGLAVWVTVSIRTGIIANRTWLFSLVVAVFAVFMLFLQSNHTERR